MGANCFCVVADQIVEGIPVHTPWGRLPISPHSPCRDVASINKAHWNSGLKKLDVLPRHAEAPRIYHLMFLQVSEIDFGGHPYLPGLNIWPGGELPMGDPVWRGYSAGDPLRLRETPRKAELFRLSYNGKLLVVDGHGGIRILQRTIGRWVLQEPTLDELIVYFCNKGEVSKTSKGVLWATHNLRRIQQEKPEHPDIPTALNLLARRLREVG